MRGIQKNYVEGFFGDIKDFLSETYAHHEFSISLYFNLSFSEKLPFGLLFYWSSIGFDFIGHVNLLISILLIE
jgi:hypothetical protein